MTKAESNWMDAIVRLGCIICLREGRGPTPAEPHHILSGGRRLGHLLTIPLCPTHHRSGLNNQQFVSRHNWRREFEARYGSEASLLSATQQLVAGQRRVA